MRRREFITLIGASVAAWPLTVRAQQRMKRIGVLMALPADDPETQARLAAFAQGLQQLGWTVVKTFALITAGGALRPCGTRLNWYTGSFQQCRHRSAADHPRRPDRLHGRC